MAILRVCMIVLQKHENSNFTGQTMATATSLYKDIWISFTLLSLNLWFVGSKNVVIESLNQFQIVHKHTTKYAPNLRGGYDLRKTGHPTRIIIYRPFSKSYIVFNWGLRHLDANHAPKTRTAEATKNSRTKLLRSIAVTQFECVEALVILCVMRAPNGHSIWTSPTWFAKSILEKGEIKGWDKLLIRLNVGLQC